MAETAVRLCAKIYEPVTSKTRPSLGGFYYYLRANGKGGAGDRFLGPFYLRKGYAGEGTLGPREGIHVDGKVFAQTMDATSGGYNVRWEGGRPKRESSSRRYKAEIQSFHDNFDVILEVELRIFIHIDSGQKRIGYMAEEFYQLGLGDLVVYDDQPLPHAVRYELTSAYIIEMLSELKSQDDLLGARIQALEEK